MFFNVNLTYLKTNFFKSTFREFQSKDSCKPVLSGYILGGVISYTFNASTQESDKERRFSMRLRPAWSKY